jgi:two-component system, OmpR family, sensor histidine kinase QseC
MKWLTPPNSLQARLLVLLLGLVTVVWIGVAVLTWFDASHELDELLDGHLAQAASLLVVQHAKAGDANDDDDDDHVAEAPPLYKYAPQVAFQVFRKGGLVMRSANAEATALATTTTGFSTRRLPDGTQWRVFAVRSVNHDVQVFVGEQTRMRDDILWAILRSMLLPLVVALPVLALAVWAAVRSGLAPLRQLSQMLGQRRAQALEPVALPGLPSEMLPVVQSLNGLFKRIDHLLDAERRFTADAAHELRTPIAAIRAQAQVALGAGADVAQREHALRSTLLGCDHATRLVDQLLTLARLEALPQAAPARINLSAVVQRIAADLVPAALARSQTLALDAPHPCVVAGDEMLVGVLVRNLIDNALRYSPDGAQVQVSLGHDSGRVTLRVQDSGAGMTAPEIAKLGQRFVRVLGHHQSGSGLGWSIVKRLVDVYGAQVEVGRSHSLGGLAVAVRWPT